MTINFPEALNTWGQITVLAGDLGVIPIEQASDHSIAADQINTCARTVIVVGGGATLVRQLQTVLRAEDVAVMAIENYHFIDDCFLTLNATNLDFPVIAENLPSAKTQRQHNLAALRRGVHARERSMRKQLPRRR